MSHASAARRTTIRDLHEATARGEKWAMITAYDAVTARIFDDAGVPTLLVGDSAAQVIYGYDSTLPVTVELTHQRVRFLSGGDPLVSHGLQLWNTPSNRFAPKFKTDAEGFVDLRLGAGTYRFHPS